MSFTEKVKLEVKKKANFRCCHCNNIGVDVHHIKPQRDGGEDSLNNAAPLCQNCHDQFGDNPNKRKEITQMRDHWYEVVERTLSPNISLFTPEVKKLNEQLKEIKNDQRNKGADISEIKDTLRELSNKVIDNITPGTVSVSASNIVKASGASVSNIDVDSIPKMMMCMECGGPSMVVKGNDPRCMGCGEPLYH